MSQELEKKRVVQIKKESTTKPTIKPHPKDILDLDEETVSIARLKLAGVDFDEIFGDEDRSSPELMIRTQANRIRDLFRTPKELKESFASPQKIKEAQKDMMIDGIDLDFIKDYCNKKQMDFESDEEALLLVAFNPTTDGGKSV